MYRIFAEGIKIHWASDEFIAYKVAENLKKRYDVDPKVNNLGEENEFWYDPGGMCKINQEKFEFDVGDLTISCDVHRFRMLVDIADATTKIEVERA